MKKIILSVAFCLGIATINAQTKEELQSQKAEKQAAADALQAEANAIQAKIDALPGWTKGAFGTIGGSISEFNNWYSQAVANNSSGNIGFTVNGFANLNQEKFFWKNSANINLGWVKLDNKDIATDNEDFQQTTDVFNITSLYGRKLSEKWAASALAEYRTTVLSNFNDPGYLDFGIGFTWTPIENLVVVIHPLNYNFVFSKGDSVFQSSLGAKIVADYTRQIGPISFKSNLSMFQSYESSNLSNLTWINSFSYTLWKKIGVGFDVGIRDNKQEAVNFEQNRLNDLPMIPAGTETPSFENIDNDLQTYWLLGLSYSF